MHALGASERLRYARAQNSLTWPRTTTQHTQLPDLCILFGAPRTTFPSAQGPDPADLIRTRRQKSPERPRLHRHEVFIKRKTRTHDAPTPSSSRHRQSQAEPRRPSNLSLKTIQGQAKQTLASTVPSTPELYDHMIITRAIILHPVHPRGAH
jgi:hypothetical protein